MAKKAEHIPLWIGLILLCIVGYFYVDKEIQLEEEIKDLKLEIRELDKKVDMLIIGMNYGISQD